MKDEKLRISVVIPTLDRCLPLQRALNSVFKQSILPEEVIVVDNGSVDNTVEMIRSNFSSVKLLFEKKIGVSAARNLGIKKSTGNWVALLDSDDEWHPKKLERQIDFCNNSMKSVRLVHTNEVWKKKDVFKAQMKKHKKSGGNIFLECLPLCCISPSSSFLRKDIFQDIGYFDEYLPACEDYDFWLRVCSTEDVFFIDEELVIKHGGHNDQLSRQFWAMDRFRVYSLEKLLTNGKLSLKNETAAISILITKLSVLIKGGMRRKNIPLVEFYLRKKKFWTNFMQIPKEPKILREFELKENCCQYFK